MQYVAASAHGPGTLRIIVDVFLIQMNLAYGDTYIKTDKEILTLHQIQEIFTLKQIR